MNLNDRAVVLVERLLADAEQLRIAPAHSASGARIIDCGIDEHGGLEAGRRLAEICTAGLASVEFAPADVELIDGLSVMVRSDHPVAACMGAQYAGWQLKSGKFFAMGSGPMRAAAGKEEILARLGLGESARSAVGVLESRLLPPEDLCREIAGQCNLTSDRLTLLVAPTASQAGTVQVVARSLETALHKLFELGFDLSRVESGCGVAPLPPVAANDLAAIGRTNDAILYGGQVTLWVRGDDESLQAIGPRVPSSASSDHGQPFAAIFERYNRDFYAIDPHLFSPAQLTLQNLDTGRSFRFGHTLPRVIHESFDVRQLGF